MSEAAPDQPLAGRVAVITGGARGQGRSHALALARLGADVAVCDACEDVATIGYPMATREDLEETDRLVEAASRRCVSSVVDVRDLDAVIAFVDGARSFLGSVDIMVANAGVSGMGSVCDLSAAQWADVLDVSSMLGRTSQPFVPAYTASKWGVIGLCKSAAQELAGNGVTVNVVAPGNVATPMIHNDTMYRLMRPDLEHPTRDDVAATMAGLHVQPVPWLEPEEVTAAVVFLVSEDARHITGSVIDVDAGASARFTA
jgi:NAD(P)-dependent dehydrogenase (short-subunit alcohol dehydrogenase family)